MMKRIIDASELLARRWPNTSAGNRELLEYVKPIVADVAANGDQAVRQYTERFDKVKLDSFKVTTDEIQIAYSKVTQEQADALRESRRRLEIVESQRLAQSNFMVEISGANIRCTLKPIRSVGCYVPGGKAAYPSSVIMNVAPAKVAGVERVVVCTPPDKDGSVDPLTLVACDICMVDEVYKIGGVQAIAALAYGTESVPRVEKIVGPGNKYVTAAKTLVSGVVSIDKPAGPTEILIIADETSDPRLIAFDLISQAEHGSGGISGLVTISERVADEVDRLVGEMVPSCMRSEVISEVLAEGGFIYTVSCIDEAIDFANRFAPEHLEVMTGIPEEVAEKITNSGLILLGNYTPVSSTDYCMGVNHVLPTEGYAKVSSGITILDYMKPVSVVKASRTGLGSVREKVAALAEAEGLPNHREAVEARFK
ncbi:histidinol dehydrogenase [Candidatus Bathyarchaeota archaeon]|nr:MAG: histidinol dehydrogenase [Candidatus Bathyarchaeota archaeon]